MTCPDSYSAFVNPAAEVKGSKAAAIPRYFMGTATTSEGRLQFARSLKDLSLFISSSYQPGAHHARIARHAISRGAILAVPEHKDTFLSQVARSQFLVIEPSTACVSSLANLGEILVFIRSSLHFRLAVPWRGAPEPRSSAIGRDWQGLG